MYTVTSTTSTNQDLVARLVKAGHTAKIEDGVVVFTPFEDPPSMDVWRPAMMAHFGLEFVEDGNSS